MFSRFIFDSIINLLFLTKLFCSELILHLSDIPRTAECIAAVMAGMFIRQDMKVEFQLPRQMTLANRLSLSKSVVREVWKLLLKKYKIIITKKGVGTYRVNELTERNREAIEESIRQALKMYSKANLDSPWLYSLGQTVDSKVKYALSLYLKMSYADLSLKVIPGLIILFARFCSMLISYNFGSEEIYYCKSYYDMITKAFEIWCAPKHKVVLMTSVSKDMSKAMRKANRALVFIEMDNSAQSLLKVDHLCRDDKVGLLYFGPTIPYPLLRELGEDFWEQLQQLQRIYKFKILLDHPLPHEIKLPDLLKGQQDGSNDAVVIITKPSSHFLLREISIIAGPEDGINRFKKKFHTNEPLASPDLTYALLYLLDEGKLQKNEIKAYAQVNQLVQAVKEYLIKKGIFRNLYLEKQQLWFFYLEPDTGTLPRNYYKKLAELNLVVGNPRQYGSVPEFAAGLFISIGFYADLNQALKHIGRLINVITSLKSQPI